MPLFAFLASFFGFVVSAETSRILSKGARVVAFVAVLIGLTAALIGGFDSALSSISASLPADVVVIAQALLPSNSVPCISIVAAGRVGRYVYDWNVKIADKLSN